MRTFLILTIGWLVLTGSARAAAAETRVMTVTAYCSCKICCGHWSGGPTASGAMPVAGVTVAGPRAVKFGTRISIDGVGARVVQDRLAKKYDDRIDVFMSDHKAAMKFGKQRLKVTFETEAK